MVANDYNLALQGTIQSCVSNDSLTYSCLCHRVFRGMSTFKPKPQNGPKMDQNGGFWLVFCRILGFCVTLSDLVATSKILCHPTGEFLGLNWSQQTLVKQHTGPATTKQGPCTWSARVWCHILIDFVCCFLQADLALCVASCFSRVACWWKQIHLCVTCAVPYVLWALESHPLVSSFCACHLIWTITCCHFCVWGLTGVYYLLDTASLWEF